MVVRQSGSLDGLLLLLIASLSQATSATAESTFLQRRTTGDDPSHGEELPPLDLHRSTNINLLPAQICGIVGAYFFTITVIGVCLLTFGRRMRKEARFGKRLASEVEMIKAPGHLHDPPPISPTSTTRSLKKFFRRGSESSTSRAGSTLGSVHYDQSHGSFDARVMQDNKARSQQELGMLYQAVMDHEATTSRPNLAASTNEKSGLRHLAVSHDAASTYSPVDSISMRSPVEAVYPPDYSSGPMAQNGAVAARVSHLPVSPRSAQFVAPTNEAATSKKSGRWNKNLRINPVATRRIDNDDDERTPLSATFASSGHGNPITPYTAKSDATQVTVITEYSEDGYENLDQPQPLPRPAPHRAPSHPDNLNAARSAASSTSTLPLRNLSSVGLSDVPPTPVKTTYLDARNKGAQRGPRTAGLTPATGVPMTPYSPYMPFTPITPVASHLVTRKERKNMVKSNKRRNLADDDGGLVSSTAETFGSAY